VVLYSGGSDAVPYFSLLAEARYDVVMHIQYAMIFVSDMSQATAFYRDVIGFPLKFESPGWTEFATTGATLALHPTPSPAPPAGDHNPAGTARFGFEVPDITAFHNRMLEHGVPCISEPKEQFGATLAQYSGPDGMIFSVGEARG
jgi:lactoylglutathione lyase